MEHRPRGGGGWRWQSLAQFVLVWHPVGAVVWAPRRSDGVEPPQCAASTPAHVKERPEVGDQFGSAHPFARLVPVVSTAMHSHTRAPPHDNSKVERDGLGSLRRRLSVG